MQVHYVQVKEYSIEIRMEVKLDSNQSGEYSRAISRFLVLLFTKSTYSCNPSKVPFSLFKTFIHSLLLKENTTGNELFLLFTCHQAQSLLISSFISFNK